MSEAKPKKNQLANDGTGKVAKKHQVIDAKSLAIFKSNRLAI